MILDNSQVKIAFCAKMRSGKDEAAQYLMCSLLPEAKIMKFADPLYELSGMIQSYCGFKIEKDRELLQYLGTDYARKRNPEVWVDLFLKKVENTSNSIICTDCRFLNEIKALKKAGFILIKIEVSESVRLARGAEPRLLQHDSELDIDKFSDYDYVIDNNGSLEEFYAKLFTILTDNLSVGTA